MNKKSNYKTIIEILATVVSILLMKIGNEYLGMALLLLIMLYDIILIIKNYQKNRK